MHGLRVLLVSHAFPPTFGGVESHVHDIAAELAQRGHRVACLVGGERVADEVVGGVTVRRRPPLRVDHLLAYRADPGLRRELEALLDRELARFEPSVVHIHNAHHFAPQLAEALFAAAQGAALVNSVHDRVGEHLYPGVLRLRWRHTIFASHYLRDALPASDTPASVMWLGIDLSAFAPRGPRDPRLDALERPVVFHPARLLRWKGVHVGVDAFARLRRRLGRGSLVLCASRQIVDDPAGVAAYRDELELLAARAGVADHVHFLEFERSRMPAAYRSSDLVWYPTVDEEPLGLVPLEAMAIGVPLVVSASGGMRETVVDGETGLVVPVGDADALADAATALLADQTLRGSIVAAGQARSRLFALPPYVDRLEAIYFDCAG